MIKCWLVNFYVELIVTLCYPLSKLMIYTRWLTKKQNVQRMVDSNKKMRNFFIILLNISMVIYSSGLTFYCAFEILVQGFEFHSYQLLHFRLRYPYGENRYQIHQNLCKMFRAFSWKICVWLVTNVLNRKMFSIAAARL